jgi:periplasmic divalent cation tolerance protein
MTWVTCPNLKSAEKISTTIVRERLAACVNLLPLKASIFRWKGKVERAREVLMIIKTRRDAFQRLKRRIRALHPYDVPEIIATPIAAGDRSYLAWVRSEVR